jgi:diaminohydroxyphosphoribosylaminopyrimidine deaminase/5-amino-6-(5-phosphoribosylamino)uracil reductase
VNEPEAMDRALELAWRGWGKVHPNPLVGAVVLAGGEPVGEGWHAEYGGRHAEPEALDRAGPRAADATLVVNLEPCLHQGLQPPCTDAILHAGVKRVVVAVADPNPIAAGGAERLRAAGVEVEVGLRGEEARAQNAAFLHRIRDSSRPFVALKLATTLDGQIADLAGHSRWVSGEEARDFVHWLRAGFDAVGVGGRTVRADDPSLTVRGNVQPRNAPRRIIFDAGADLDPQLALVRSARETPTILVTAPSAPGGRVARLEAAGLTILRSPDLAGAMHSLRAMDVTSLLVEGGGRLAGALLSNDLVDRYYWIQSPLWLGDRGVPAVSGLPSGPIERAERWRVVERRSLGADTLLVLDRR